MGNLREIFYFDIDKFPAQVDLGKGVYCQLFWWYVGVIVASNFCRCESYTVSLFLVRLNMYHTCPGLVVIKKNSTRESPKLVGKVNNKGNKHYQVQIK